MSRTHDSRLPHCLRTALQASSALAGAVARRLRLPTRSIIRSLPFTVTRSGCYTVIGDLVGVPDSPGITIEADDVTIDLAGHTLVGVPGSLAAVDGPGRQRLAVVNGTIRNWGDYGLVLGPQPSLRDLYLM